MSRLKVVAMVFVSFGALAAGTMGLARPAPQEKGPPAEARSDLKDAGVAPRVLKPAEVEADADFRLQQIEASKLDIELLRMEVVKLRYNVESAQNASLQAQEQVQAWLTPTPGFPGTGQSVLGQAKRPTGQALEDAKKEFEEYINFNQQRLADARQLYLSRSNDLRRQEAKLKGLLHAEASQSATFSQRAGEAKPTADIERRLSDVERKLDLILKALENQARESSKK